MSIKDNVKSIGDYIRIVLIAGALIVTVVGVIFSVYEVVRTNETGNETLVTLQTIVNQQHITDLELKTFFSEKNHNTNLKLALIQKSVEQNHKDYLVLKKAFDDFTNRFVIVRKNNV